MILHVLLKAITDFRCDDSIFSEDITVDDKRWCLKLVLRKNDEFNAFASILSGTLDRSSLSQDVEFNQTAYCPVIGEVPVETSDHDTIVTKLVFELFLIRRFSGDSGLQDVEIRQGEGMAQFSSDDFAISTTVNIYDKLDINCGRIVLTVFYNRYPLELAENDVDAVRHAYKYTSSEANVTVEAKSSEYAFLLSRRARSPTKRAVTFNGSLDEQVRGDIDSMDYEAKTELDQEVRPMSYDNKSQGASKKKSTKYLASGRVVHSAKKLRSNVRKRARRMYQEMEHKQEEALQEMGTKGNLSRLATDLQRGNEFHTDNNLRLRKTIHKVGYVQNLWPEFPLDHEVIEEKRRFQQSLLDDQQLQLFRDVTDQMKKATITQTKGGKADSKMRYTRRMQEIFLSKMLSIKERELKRLQKNFESVRTRSISSSSTKRNNKKAVAASKAVSVEVLASLSPPRKRHASTPPQRHFSSGYAHEPPPSTMQTKPGQQKKSSADKRTERRKDSKKKEQSAGSPSSSLIGTLTRVLAEYNARKQQEEVLKKDRNIFKAGLRAVPSSATAQRANLIVELPRPIPEAVEKVRETRMNKKKREERREKERDISRLPKKKIDPATNIVLQDYYDVISSSARPPKKKSASTAQQQNEQQHHEVESSFDMEMNERLVENRLLRERIMQNWLSAARTQVNLKQKKAACLTDDRDLYYNGVSSSESEDSMSDGKNDSLLRGDLPSDAANEKAVPSFLNQFAHAGASLGYTGFDSNSDHSRTVASFQESKAKRGLTVGAVEIPIVTVETFDASPTPPRPSYRRLGSDSSNPSVATNSDVYVSSAHSASQTTDVSTTMSRRLQQVGTDLGFLESRIVKFMNLDAVSDDEADEGELNEENEKALEAKQFSFDREGHLAEKYKKVAEKVNAAARSQAIGADEDLRNDSNSGQRGEVRMIGHLEEEGGEDEEPDLSVNESNFEALFEDTSTFASPSPLLYRRAAFQRSTPK